MANENYDPYDQAYWGKGKGNPDSNMPMMETRVIYPVRMAKERADMKKEESKTFAAIAEKLEEHPATQPVAELQEPAYAGWTDQDWDQSWTWNEQGWYSSYETSSTGQASMTHMSIVRRRPSTGS